MLHPKFCKAPTRPILGSLVGPLIGGALSLIGGERRNDAAADQSSAQMEFQREMSNTAYQRGVVDMKAAGLNPMLAYSQGGASTPGGAQASMEDTITPAISTAMQYQRMEADVKNVEAQTDLLRAQRDKTSQETINAGTTNSRLVEEISNLKVERDRIIAATNQADTTSRVNVAQVEKLVQDVKESFSREDLNRVREVLAKASVAEAQVLEQFFKSELGDASPVMKFLMSVISVIRGARSQ